MRKYVQVITTTESKEDAERIAQVLVEKRLAACVQIIGPIASTYWWKEKIEKAEEWLCLIKTSKDLYQRLESTIRSLHSYEVPEIMAILVEKGSNDYFSWLDGELKKVAD